MTLSPTACRSRGAMASGTKELRLMLERQGEKAAAKATLHITGARRIGRVVTFEVPDALAYNSLKNDVAAVEKALGVMLGGPSKMILVRSFDERKEKPFSPEMIRLQEFFRRQAGPRGRIRARGVTAERGPCGWQGLGVRCIRRLGYSEANRGLRSCRLS